MAKVLLSIPDKFLTQIDEVAENEQRTRSELIREALRTYMKRNVAFDAKKINADAQLLDKLLD
ncbi:ribbon-helix-helix protein, CopG family [bacterium]|nr:ribbon-helix-helix protein, CopG family [bacterium]